MHRPPFSDQNAVKIYRRNLTHWRQEGATYFITFRLADALPKRITEQWESEKSLCLAARGISKASANWQSDVESKLSKKEQFEFRREFNRKLNHHLDRGHGACHFRTDPALATLQEKLLEDDRTHYYLGDFILMPNHVHLLLNLIKGLDLERTRQKIKGGFAFLVNKVIKRSGKLWQREYYDHLVRDAKELIAFRNYIQENPNKAGIRLPDHSYREAEWLTEALANHHES